MTHSIDSNQVMTFFVLSFMFDSKKSDNGADQYIFPRDMQFIPEFTVVDMHIMTSHNDTEGVRVQVEADCTPPDHAVLVHGSGFAAAVA